MDNLGITPTQCHYDLFYFNVCVYSLHNADYKKKQRGKVEIPPGDLAVQVAVEYVPLCVIERQLAALDAAAAVAVETVAQPRPVAELSAGGPPAFRPCP